MTTLDDLWNMVCLGGVLLAFVGFIVAAAFAIAQELRQAQQASNADDDGEPRDVPEDAPVYELRLDSALGAPLPGGVAAWLIADTEAAWQARQRGTGGVR